MEIRKCSKTRSAEAGRRDVYRVFSKIRSQERVRKRKKAQKQTARPWRCLATGMNTEQVSTISSRPGGSGAEPGPKQR